MDVDTRGSAGIKLAAYGVVLALVLGGGAAVGAAVGPIDGDEPAHPSHPADDGPVAAGHDEEDTMPTGLQITQDDYALEADATTVEAGGTWRFHVRGPDGSAVTDFTRRHERDLHLIVASRDLTTFAHLHPERDGAGTWTATLPDLAPGGYRAFADFAVAGGPELTLGADLAVAGAFEPAPLPTPSAIATVEGYEVALSGAPSAGSTSEVVLTVTRDGRPVDDLDPYLGADGHLVALRAGDLAYLHVHPVDDPAGRGGPTVRFGVTVPSPGTYRLFFDFSHHGRPRTAAFTVTVTAPTTPGPADHH